MAPPLVLKFGGTSLGTPARMRRAVLRMAAHARRGRAVAAVVSAPGHTTDRILAWVDALGGRSGPDGSLREVDRALATGEDLAAALLCAGLRAQGIAAVSLRGGEAGLVADGPFGAGTIREVRSARLRSLLADGIVPVVSGFQAVRADGETLTLGRGGSDTSAVALAAALGGACHIVTDVHGVHALDPRVDAAAPAFDHLTHDALLALAEAGAHVVHPTAARLARDRGVPLRIYHYRAPLRGTSGTRVAGPSAAGGNGCAPSLAGRTNGLLPATPPHTRSIRMLQPAPHLDGIEQALSIRYNNQVYEMKARGEDVIVLSLGEAFFDIPLYDFAEMPMPDGFHYSHSRGVPGLRRRLAEYYHRLYRVPVDPESEIIVTAGSKIAIHMSLMAVLSPGDEALVLEPAWVSYSEQVKLCHGVPVMVPHDTPIAGLERFVTARTRVVIVNNPNNPSGKVFTPAELAHLHELADRHGLFLLSDEAYSEFVDGGGFVSCGVMDPEKRHTIVCNSMSKNYGMSGWRIGYVIGNRALIDEILKINQHLVTCPATILEHYLERHFDDILAVTRPQIADLVRRRRELAGFMDGLGLSHMPGDATFYFFVSIEPSRLSSEEFCTRLLTERGVSTVPGMGYGRSCDRFIRVSVGTESMERTREGISRIHALVAETAAVLPGAVRLPDASPVGV